MRDPTSWSLAIGRVAGITVRVHILLPIVALGVILRVATQKDVIAGTWIDASMLMGLAFIAIFLHEMGHCFAARRVNGEASEVLLWPLGGLAYADVPHTPRANLIMVLGGPLANVLLCLLCGALLLFAFEQPIRPTWNLLWYPYRSNEAGKVMLSLWGGGDYLTNDLLTVAVARMFWLNWWMCLINFLPAWPLDGGRIFQCLLWPRFGFRQATQYAIFSGFMTMLVIVVISFASNEVMPLVLAIYIYIACKQEWIILETGGEESLFGYDFSQGYTSLEREEAPPIPRRKRASFFKRWMQRRAADKHRREVEKQEAEEGRMDALLEKIQQYGKQSLTDEEQRFLKRVADRYRNRP